MYSVACQPGAWYAASSVNIGQMAGVAMAAAEYQGQVLHQQARQLGIITRRDPLTQFAETNLQGEATHPFRMFGIDAAIPDSQITREVFSRDQILAGENAAPHDVERGEHEIDAFMNSGPWHTCRSAAVMATNLSSTAMGGMIGRRIANSFSPIRTPTPFCGPICVRIMVESV